MVHMTAYDSGFDCAGMALYVWNELTVERASSFGFEIEGEGARHLPRDKSNLVEPRSHENTM